MASRDLAESLLPAGGGGASTYEYEERAYDSDDKVSIAISDSDGGEEALGEVAGRHGEDARVGEWGK
jgi:natural resistance-associated macrophage protein